MTAALVQAFDDQRKYNSDLGSAFTARLLRLIGARIALGTPVMDKMRSFEGDLGPLGHAVPLRLLSGIHALVLSGKAPELAALFPPAKRPEDDELGAALDHVLEDHADALVKSLDIAPQTNEVRRSVVMIAIAHWLADRFGLPLKVSDLGSSAGLTLNFDAYAMELACGHFGAKKSPIILSPEWLGPCLPMVDFTVAERRGVDIAPKNPQDPDDALQLMSYMWPDQPNRIARTRAALAICHTPIDTGDAADWLEERLATPAPGQVHLVTNLLSWKYFSDESQKRCLAALDKAGAAATKDAPIARLSMEIDSKNDGAMIELTIWPDGKVYNMGRVDFHGRWVNWSPPK